MKFKTDVPGLTKDISTGAVLNEDESALEAYKKKKAFFRNQENMDRRLNTLENDISEIKGLLRSLVQDKDN